MGPFTPNFTTSKRVEAYRIVEISSCWVVLDRGGRHERIEPPLGFFHRMPRAGDMLVRYVDGTVSHCPAEVFLRDATPLVETPLPSTELPAVDEPRVPRRPPLGGGPIRPSNGTDLPPGCPHP